MKVLVIVLVAISIVGIFLVYQTTGPLDSRITLTQRDIKKVLLLSVDDLRPDYLTPYNPGLGTSPNLARFAADGLLFTNVVSQATSTLVSHKSIFYSLYPSVHKTTLKHVPEETLVNPVEALRSAGFRTAAFVGGGQLRAKFGFDRGFQSYETLAKKKVLDRGEDPLEVLRGNALEWVRENRDDDFFLFLHTYEVHCPYTPPARFVKKYAGWYEGEIKPRGKCGARYYNKREMSEEDYRYVGDLYAAGVAYVDDFVGKLFDGLKEIGVYDEMIIIVLSDHGESLGEHDYIGHNRLYEEQLKIPLMMRIPGVNAATINAPVEAIDIMPTLFSILGLQPPYSFQGQDLVPDIAGKREADTNRRRIAEAGKGIAIQSGDWKLVFDSRDPKEDALFDLRSDPKETDNVASEHPQIVSDLRNYYAAMIGASQGLASRFEVSGTNVLELDEQTKQELRALGYIR
ncbi:MAG: sulfatase [Acidobacteriota bacterium]